MNIFITADNHFNHENIIGYCSRRFDTVYDMNRELIRRWNETVSPSDMVFHLGDFAFKHGARTPEALRAQLNGKIILIRGNHDGSPRMMRAIGFEKVFNEFVLSHGRHRIYLRHRPTKPCDWLHGCTMHLCGHVHGAWRYHHDFRAVNAGVDVWDYRPIPIEDAIALWEKEND